MADNDKAKLKTLLDYWIKHNEEHELEFREWAGKAGALGAVDAGAHLLKAAQAMYQATESLSKAQKELEE